MRTLNKIREAFVQARNEFFEPDFLAAYLPHKDLQGIYHIPDGWQPRPRDRNSVIAEMRDYMSFAWDKANNCRGLSAYRSMVHYKVWLWLLKDDSIDTEEYEYYGKPQLAMICKKYGFRNEDNGIWKNSELDDGIPAKEV